MKRTSGIILSLLLFLSLSLPAQERDRTELEQALRTLVERKRAETGIAVILNGTDTVTVNDAGRYPMMSVFKFHQALAVADFLDRNGLPCVKDNGIRDRISITPTGTASTTAAGVPPAAIGNQSIPGCPYHNEPGRRTCAAPVIRPMPELT